MTDAGDTAGGPDATAPEPFETLEFRELVQGCGALQAEPGARILETQEAFQQVFEERYPDAEFRPPTPAVDFDRNVVVEARWGSSWPEDYYFVSRVRELEARVEVTLTFRTACADGDSEAYACSLSEVPRRDKPYVFVEAEPIFLMADAGVGGFCRPDGSPRFDDGYPRDRSP